MIEEREMLPEDLSLIIITAGEKSIRSGPEVVCLFMRDGVCRWALFAHPHVFTP
jgi:hypothetical protein